MRQSSGHAPFEEDGKATLSQRSWARTVCVVASILFLSYLSASAQQPATNWNQFRGPNGQGVAPTDHVPAHFGPDTNAIWNIATPPGHSSPVIWGDRIFLTGYGEGRTLETLAVGRTNGRILWQKSIQSERKPNLHQLNDPASSTPAADEKHVYAYFGTYGLICYDHAGNKLWERELPTPRSKYGVATSPILYRDMLILAMDGDGGTAKLLAFNRDTGETVWEAARPLFHAGWSTPMIFHHDNADELVLLGSKRLTAYDPSDGHELWWSGGFSNETVNVPVTGDGLLFASAAALGGRGDDDIDAERTWKMTLDQFDTNHDGKIEKEEMTEGFGFIQRPELPKDNPGYAMPVRNKQSLLRMFDRNHDGVITKDEWMKAMADFAATSRPNLEAIRPGAKDDARKTHLAWEKQHGVPEVPSPLYYEGKLYLLRDGGILTCLKAATGQELFQGRLGARGQYIASPIAAGDKIVVASAYGVVTVVEGGDHLKVLASNDFKEQIFATPAIAGDHLYVRTENHLYALGAAK